ncbi:MAG: efflux RND transporter periplasmic adaptor subunit [Thermodesulfovibrionia bacterium]|nr:efflux RND transporter periplasmic adaptor subunit [Thermodesulfovibrionia bacterium]
MNRGWIKYALAAVLLFVSALFFYQKAYVPKRTFTTVSPLRGDLEVEVFGIGEVDAKNIYTISSQSGGKLDGVYKDQGEWVKNGELLAVIDPVDLKSKLAEGRAAYQKALLEIEAAKKEYALNEERHKLALLTYERYDRLYKKEYVAQAEYDNAKTEMLTSEIQLQGNGVNIRSGEAEAAGLLQSINGIEAKLKTLQIRSPIDGYVIVKEAETSETVTPSQPILRIVDPETLWIRTYIDERISGDIRAGQRAGITLRSQPDRSFSGHVSRINTMSDSVTQERVVEIIFDEIPMPFFVNEQAEVHIQVKTLSNILKIPASLIVAYGGKKGVWISKDKAAHFQTLEIIAQSDDEVAVGSGIDENSRIIIPDAHKKTLHEGMSIRP